MKKLILVICLLIFSLMNEAIFAGFANEYLSRGMISSVNDNGSVFIGWRMLDKSEKDTEFLVKRFGNNDQKAEKTFKINSNNIIDDTAHKDKKYTYKLYKNSQKNGQLLDQVKVNTSKSSEAFLKIPFQGDYAAQKVGIGDLDGDGDYEYVIKQPNFNTDPYQRPGYWKPSTTTYKIETYEQDGTFLWRYDMGWAIEAGIWYSPWIVYDVDGDGKAEVYCKAGEGDPREPEGHVKTGPEYLVKLDPETGKIIQKTDWISREGYVDYNRSCRNFLTVAYLDGKTPSLIMQRGTYKLIRTKALDKDFNEIWTWEATEKNADYRGQGSHGLITADVDEDGRDELVIGAAVIDDNGKGLWTLGMGHPDVCYVADIVPDNPGLEVYYGLETRQKTDGICVVDAKTGKKLWALKEQTYHVHGQGMIGDLLADYPGIEVYSGERDYEKRWFYSAKGKMIDFFKDTPLTPRPLWWDADPQKEIVWDGAIRDWQGKAHQPVSGRVIGIADCLGDHREELITSRDGELRIYTTSIPSQFSRTCLMLNRQYRLGVTAQTMGYYYPAQLGLE